MTGTPNDEGNGGTFKELPLLGDMPGQNIMKLIDDQQPQLNGPQQVEHLPLFFRHRTPAGGKASRALRGSRCRIGFHPALAEPEGATPGTTA